MPQSLFSKNVLNIVRCIPRGNVLTYGEVAEHAGSARAARAVGTLMRRNYDGRIPCHRVIKSDGRVGNYNRGGAKKKILLLKSEGVHIMGNRVQR